VVKDLVHIVQGPEESTLFCIFTQLARPDKTVSQPLLLASAFYFVGMDGRMAMKKSLFVGDALR
jgi:hypothetical protein